MLSKKSIKVLSIVLLVVVLLVTLGSSVMAVTVPEPTDPSATSISQIEGPVKTILGIIQWGGIVAAVAVAMFIGIKYITASPEGKAEIKKTLGLYVAGVAILLSASAIVTFIMNALGK